MAEANKYQNDSLHELSAHFRFCTFWRSCYPQLTAANVRVSERAMNNFVLQMSTKKYSTTVSSNIIACTHELLRMQKYTDLYRHELVQQSLEIWKRRH